MTTPYPAAGEADLIIMKAVILSQTPPSRAAITEHLSVQEDMAERPGLNLKASKENPVVLGQEFSGVVEDIGSKVKNFKVGDNVLAHKVMIPLRL